MKVFQVGRSWKEVVVFEDCCFHLVGKSMDGCGVL